MTFARTAVVLTGVALVASSCASGGHHGAFSEFSTVGDLSVPTPHGFQHRAWSGGVTVSDGPITGGWAEFPASSYLPHDRDRVTLTVYRLREMSPGMLARHIHLPLTLKQLVRGGGAWSGGVLRGGAFVYQKQISGFRTKAYGVQLWIGRGVSAAHRSAVLGALNAVKPS